MNDLPFFNYHGYLPEGIHPADLAQVRDRFAFNPSREFLYGRLEEFLNWAISTGNFSEVYIAGGFVTNKAQPEDIDVILQTKAGFSPAAFKAMEPFFARGLAAIFETYSVHLHFRCEGFPNGVCDFRQFFQYLKPQEAAPLGLKETARKGIIRIALP